MVAAAKRTKTTKPVKDIRIVVLQRGWVYVGEYSAIGDEVMISNARCMRRWGTTGGLAQLATQGPTPATELEAPCEVRCHALAVISTIACVATVWPCYE